MAPQADTPEYRIELLRFHAEQHREKAALYRAGKVAGCPQGSIWAESYAVLCEERAAEFDAEADQMTVLRSARAA